MMARLRKWLVLRSPEYHAMKALREFWEEQCRIEEASHKAAQRKLGAMNVQTVLLTRQLEEARASCPKE